MPQIQLPIFPEGVTHITPVLAFSKQDGRVTYFNLESAVALLPGPYGQHVAPNCSPMVVIRGKVAVLSVGPGP